jgi:tetratricopeptide (TPR) repeat protein
MTAYLLLFFLLQASPDPSGAASVQAEADAHNTQGKILYGRGEFEAALAEFHAAFELERDSRYLFNAAKALERLGRPADAFAAWSEFILLAPSAEEREAAARILVQLCPDVGGGAVRLESKPGGLALTLDGRAFPVPAPVEVCLPPGEHRVGATREGYQPLEQVVSVARGGRRNVTLTLKPAVVQGLLAVTPTVKPTTFTPPVEKPFNWGWVTLGAGVAAVLTGTALYAVAFDKYKRADGLNANAADYDRRFSDLANSGARYQTGAWVGWGLGAALAIPTVWLFTRDADTARAAAGGK